MYLHPHKKVGIICMIIFLYVPNFIDSKFPGVRNPSLKYGPYVDVYKRQGPHTAGEQRWTLDISRTCLLYTSRCV